MLTGPFCITTETGGGLFPLEKQDSIQHLILLKRKECFFLLIELVFLRENGDIPDVFNITFKDPYYETTVIHDNCYIFKTDYNFFAM